MCLSSGCNKEEMAAFRGDGTLRHHSKPGVLGVDGYVLQFAPFSVSNGFAARLTFSDIPVRKDPYWIYLVPDQKAMALDFGDARVSFTLSDADGGLVLGVTNRIADWIESKYHTSPSMVTREYRMARSKDETESASFMPKVGGRYIVNISYKPASSLTNSPDTAHFEVRCSAGK
jgi:hypothetical protein